MDGNGNAVISGEQSTPSSAPADVLNSSASKIDLSYDSKDNENYNKRDTDATDDLSSTSSTHKTSSNMNTKCMYMLTDIILLELFHLVGRCPIFSGQIDVTVDFAAKKGFAQKVMLNCTSISDCDWTSYLSTSVK